MNAALSLTLERTNTVPGEASGICKKIKCHVEYLHASMQ